MLANIKVLTKLQLCKTDYQADRSLGLHTYKLNRHDVLKPHTYLLHHSHVEVVRVKDGRTKRRTESPDFTSRVMSVVSFSQQKNLGLGYGNIVVLVKC